MAERKEFNKVRKDDELEKKLVTVRRVTKVVKGGRKMHFSAFVVVGDKKGKVGIGSGKSAEVPAAAEKATQTAKKNMKVYNIVGSTIPHEVKGKFSTSTVLLLPAKEGTGVIASGAVRAVIDSVGIKDIVAKSYGGRNQINVVKATLDGLSKLRTREQVASLRGKKPEEV
mgnify:CR=1 FL=1